MSWHKGIRIFILFYNQGIIVYKQTDTMQILTNMLFNVKCSLNNGNFIKITLGFCLTN